MMLGAVGDSSTIMIDPITLTTSGTLPISQTVDWTDPNALVQAGDLVPSGDTYAGPLTTVAEFNAAVAANAPASAVGIPQWLLLGSVVFGLAMIAGRR